MKKIAILGSTGSIGKSALKVIDRFPHEFRIVALTAYHNISAIEKQIKRYSPKYVAVKAEKIAYLKKRIKTKKHIQFFDASSEIEKIVELPETDIVILAISGSSALLPFLKAVRCGKTVAPANKEALVMAGHIIMAEAQKHGARIIPVDSEQSAIFQCLNGNRREELKQVYLTASGGPLSRVNKKKFPNVSIKEILKHPRWKMGKKITVDSATLMNKGLEVIEAKWLFDVDVKNIRVLIHPQAIIHSMVEFKDGSLLAQLGVTDMRLPIQFALTYPKRFASGLKDLDFLKLGRLDFLKPDLKKFPALSLCYRVAEKGKTFPCVLNAANEEAVKAFLKGKIRFTDIYRVVKNTVARHKPVGGHSLSAIFKADAWARTKALQEIYSP